MKIAKIVKYIYFSYKPFNKVVKKMGKYCEATLKCSNEVHDLIMQDCVNEFKKYNPEFDETNVSQNTILRRIALYYLDRLDEDRN